MSNDNWYLFDLPNVPIIRCELGEDAVNHIWECIDTANEKINDALAGNISESFSIDDIDSKFWNDHLSLFCEDYLSEYRDMMTTSRNPFNDDIITKMYLKEFWVNYQKETDFNPLHQHSGVLSFVIWMKIPTEWREQHELPISKNSASPSASDFRFTYPNILGNLRNVTIPMGKEAENNMIIFPSTMMHQVYPFYNCSEDRISVSGNIFLQL
jgi:hypothetical protein